MNVVKDDVIKLVFKERDAANKRFPPFRSPHEGYAVILEELEEAQEVLDSSAIHLEFAWGLIKANQPPYSQIVDSYADTINSICKLVQYAAMQRKFLDMEEQE